MLTGCWQDPALCWLVVGRILLYVDWLLAGSCFMLTGCWQDPALCWLAVGRNLRYVDWPLAGSCIILTSCWQVPALCWLAVGRILLYFDWLLAGSCVMLIGCCQQPVNTTHDNTNCCLYTVDPPDDEQQAYSKHVEAYYWYKLIENNASCWFILYGYSDKDSSKKQPSSLLRTVKVKPTKAYSSLSSRCALSVFHLFLVSPFHGVRSNDPGKSTAGDDFLPFLVTCKKIDCDTTSYQMPVFNVFRISRKQWVGCVYCGQTVKTASLLQQSHVLPLPAGLIICCFSYYLTHPFQKLWYIAP
jgi:hypothetical protein